MHAFADSLIQSWFDADPATWAGTQWFYAAVIAVFGLIVILAVVVLAGIATWIERKVAGRMQSRIGPNRAGPHGIFQWMADGLKLVLKEDLIPAEADRLLYRAAPYLVMIGIMGAVAVIPFGAGSGLIVADLNVALFYFIAITGLVVVGIIVAGWSSNSKWSLLGGMRSAAQIISYEIPVALTLMIVALSAGSLSTQTIVASQGGLPWEWMIFRSPIHFIAFFIYWAGALAEGNRTPFDLPEAESELVSGYNTEYSGFRFAAFFLGEFANIWIMAAFASILFFGGGQIPGLAPAEVTGWWHLLAFAIFFAKTTVGAFVVVWIRWTLPRVRLDQMMDLCWKYFVPMGIVGILLTALWEIAAHTAPVVQTAMSAAMTLFGLLLLVAFLRRTWMNVAAVGDRVSMENW